MNDKDMIFRISGNFKQVQEFQEELIQASKELNLLPENKSIKPVPLKIKKEDVKNRAAKDMQFSVSGNENKVEEFINSVILTVEEELKLSNPSKHLKLENKNGE